MSSHRLHRVAAPCLIMSLASAAITGCSMRTSTTAAVNAPESAAVATGALGDGGGDGCAAVGAARNDSSTQPAASASSVDDAWTVKRVGGDMQAQVTGSDGDYRFERSRVDTELPEGYPAPTPPKAIDIKKYPAARRAEVSGELNADLGMNLGFWPLFQHIQRNHIAMTAPVEMDYRDWPDTRGPNPQSWTMSFLYRTADMGAAGADGRVQVVDTQPVVMLAIGMNGPYRMAAVRTGLAKLDDWLATQQEWEREPQADPRALYYNDPSVPDRHKWMEVQLPIRRKSS